MTLYKDKLLKLLPEIGLITIGFLVYFPIIWQDLDYNAYIISEYLKVYFGGYHFWNVSIPQILNPHGLNRIVSVFFYDLIKNNYPYYFIAAIGLKTSIGILIYRLLRRLTKNMIISLLAAFFYVVNFTGIELITWPTLYHNNVAVLIMLIYFGNWIKFSKKLNNKNLIICLGLFILTLITYPIRTIVVYPMSLVLDLILITHTQQTNQKLVIIKHLVITTIIFAILVLLGKQIELTDIEVGGIVNLKVLFYSLFISGKPPIIYSLLLFLGNNFINVKIFELSIINNLNDLFQINTLLLLATFVYKIGSNLRKRSCYKLATHIMLFIFINLVFFSKNTILSSFTTEMLFTVELGGSLMIYLLSFSFDKFLLMQTKLKMDIKVAMIMAFLAGLLINIILIWSISPWILDYNHRSLFLFESRYYGLTSVLAALMIGISLSLLIGKVKILAMVLCSFLIVLNILLINQYLQNRANEMVVGKFTLVK